MRPIKNVEEVKDYFEKNVDWKFYNMLLDRSLLIEDEGDYTVTFHLGVKYNGYICYCFKGGNYRKDVRIFNTHFMLEDVYVDTSKCEIVYSVNCSVSQDVAIKYYNRIKNRCILIGEISNGCFNVKPI